jgi:predicted secreted acid phosphatase
MADGAQHPRRKGTFVRLRRLITGVVAVGLGCALLQSPAGAAPKSSSASRAPSGASASIGKDTKRLTPRTHFTMKPDGSSGLTAGGERIPNIDSVKKTIYAYYGDPGTGIADKNSSPYISELDALLDREMRKLPGLYKKAKQRGDKPALVFDTDDTTLWTYDMEVAAMHFNFDPALQDVYVQGQKFPATPGMVAFVNKAEDMGFTIFGLTGRNDNQKVATLKNLRTVGYDSDTFKSRRFFTKWVSGGTPPPYVHCVATCTTVEYKAGTRRYIEKKLHYTIVGNYGDQWSDLQGGYADRAVKLPNPTYYLPSADLPSVHEPWLAPRTHFTMKPDGSSGLTVGGEGIPNIDSVKKTIYTYYGDTGDGKANKEKSPYISELKKITKQQKATLVKRYAQAIRHKEKPALVFDTDDTTLWTYDMEVAGMHFNFDPALQDVYVQGQKFPATPMMVSYVNTAQEMGYTVFGLTGRNDDQKAATIANLQKVGYSSKAFTEDRFFTKWTGVGSSQQPTYISCAAAKCTTIEYKSQTRRHIEDSGYTIVANYGDQYSDLIGGYADHTVKLPNPTYYLP